MIKQILIISLSLLALKANAHSHCGKGEIDYFSCKIKNSSKVVSFCGSSPVEEDLDKGWVQYRFGKLGKPEMVYPQEKQNSKKQFEYNYFTPYDEYASLVDIRFLNLGVFYSVSMTNSYKNNQHQYYRGGVYVQKGFEDLSLDCAKADEKYFDKLRKIPLSYDEESNKLDEFNKMIKK